MKNYFIILILSYLLSNSVDQYSVYWFGIPMADVTITNQDTIYNDINAIKLHFETKTNKLTSRLFKVDNSYETIINKKNFEILSFKKSTYQPNVTNQLYTINSENGLIYNDSINFIIPKNCFNIFSLLYYLSTTPFDKIKNIVTLEKEGLIYNCEIYKNNKNKYSEFELKFNLITQTDKPVIQHTDIFTWGLFKENGTKKIIVNNNKIKQCHFEFGLSHLKANIK